MIPASHPQLLLLLSAALHAIQSATTKVAKDKDAFVFLTILLACLLMLAALLLQDGGLVLGGSRGMKFALLAGILEGGYCVAMAKSYAATSLVKAYSIMRGGAMVLVWCLSLALAMEPFGWARFAGSALILGGIAATGWDRSRQLLLRESSWPALGAVFIAGYHICYGESLRAGAEPKALFFTSLAVCLPFIYVPARKAFRERARLIFTGETLKLSVSAVATTLGFVLFLTGLKSSGPGYAITLRNTSIFWSIGFSLLIRERPTRAQVAGATVIGVGALVMGLGG